MNVFYIPSWYPSDENPIYGTFVKEQIEMLALHNPAWHLGVSLWGQGRLSHMLWVGDHVKNIKKRLDWRTYQPSNQQSGNIGHFYTPCLTWTRKVSKGNLSGLLVANEKNLKSFISQVGKVDVIHAQATYPAALIARALSEKYKIPYVVSIRMSPFPFDEFLNKKEGLKRLIAEPLLKATTLIATSHSLKARMEIFGLSKIQVIHNPVNTEFFRPSDDEPEELILLTIGRLEHQKGIDILIEAIALLGDRFNGKMRIGGDGSLRETYQKLADEKGIAQKIQWLGELSRKHVRDEMQQCSFYVLPSRHETFGNVLLEAIACGKPVVATNCGGPADIVTENSGLLCEVENAEDLAEKIGQMVHSYKEYRVSNLTKHIGDNFHPDVFSGEITSLYNDLRTSQ